MKPMAEVEMRGEDALKMQKLLDALEVARRRAGSPYLRADRAEA